MLKFKDEHTYLNRVLYLLKKEHNFNTVFDTGKVVYFSMKNNDLWSIFADGGEFAINKVNSDLFYNVPFYYKKTLLPPYEAMLRIYEVTTKEGINFERYRSFTVTDIDVFWEIS